ncbi:MAG: hypothetical protein ACLFS3_02375 [Candidatus Aenigmatarchaeota archaeon]
MNGEDRKVCVDLDNVVYKTTESLERMINQEEKKRLISKTMKKIERGEDPSCPELEKKTEKLWEENWRDIEMNEGVGELIGTLEDLGFDIEFVTGVGDVNKKRKSLEKNGLGSYNLKLTEENKLNLDFDIYIDDNPYLMKAIESDNNGTEGYMPVGILSQFYEDVNGDFNEYEKVFKADDLKEISSLIEERYDPSMKSGKDLAAYA